MLPHQPPYRLAMDRTNWKFGEININILTLAIVYKGVAFPILISMLDKRGNSNTLERIAIILVLRTKYAVERYLRLFGYQTIDCLLADREFVGDNWIMYLNNRNIRYHINIRQNFYVDNPRNGKRFKASWMFNDLRCGECRFMHRIYYVNGQLCYLSASKQKNQEGIPELQIIISFNKPEEAGQAYKDRWQIETAFRGLKSSGFNIENTHLVDLNRIEKLFSIVMLAFAWAYLYCVRSTRYVIGVFIDENMNSIRILNNGRRAKSFFKYGLEYITEIFLNPLKISNIDIFKFLSCT